MKLEAIMKLNQRDIEKMSRRELASVVSDLRSVARKRIDRIEKNDAFIYSPAYSYIIRGGGIPTVKGMNVTQLKNEFKRYRHFIGLKTSTVKGAKRYYEKSVKNFEKLTGRGFGTEQIKYFFGLLDDLRDDGLATEKNYNSVLNYMVNYAEENPDATDEEIQNHAREEVRKEYEQSARGFYSSDRF